MILSIDPGCLESAYTLIDEDLKPVKFGKVPNDEILRIINCYGHEKVHFAIEMVASYGMAVGVEVFETVFWIGRFWHEAVTMGYIATKIYRKDVKINLCKSMKAKDSNIRQALIDRFGEVGTIKKKGWFYGFKSDIWSSYAVGVTYYDKYLKG